MKINFLKHQKVALWHHTKFVYPLKIEMPPSENSQNVNRGGIDSLILDKLTPSVTSQKQSYTQNQVRSTSYSDRVLRISKIIFIFQTQLVTYTSLIAVTITMHP